MRITLLLLAVAALVAGAFFLSRPPAVPAPDSGALGGPLAASDEAPPAPPDAAELTQAGAVSSGRATATLAPEVAAAAPPDAAGAERRPEGGRLRGRVLDSFGRPASGADVQRPRDVFFSGDPNRPAPPGTTADREGRFELALPAGEVRLRFGADGHEWLERSFTVPSSGAVEVGDVQLTQGVVLTGRVVDSRGAGVADARVGRAAPRADGLVILSIGGLEPAEELTRTDADGMFRIQRHPAGRVVLHVDHPRHPRATYEGEELRAGERRDGLLVELPDGASVAGVVLGLPPASEASGAPGYVVRARPERDGASFELGGFEGLGGGSTHEGAVAADGTFEVQGLPAAKQYRVFLVERSGDGRSVAGGFGMGGFAGLRRSAKVSAAPGARDVRLVYAEGATVQLRVVDALTKAPIENLRASIGAPWAAPLLGPDGAVREHFPGGVVTAKDLWPEGDQGLDVELTATGYVRWSRSDVRLAAGAALDLGVVELTPLPVVTVRVTDALGAPVAGARVLLSALAEDVSGGNIVSVTRSVGVRLGASLGGDTDAVRTSVRTGGEREEGTTDASGVARLNSLPGQRAEAQVFASGFVEWTSAPLELPEAAGLRVDAVLERGSAVAVTVVDRSGAPQPGVTVERRRTSNPENDDGRYRRVTGADGVARFEHVSLGPQRFRVAPPREQGGFAFVIEGLEDAGDGEWTEVDVVDSQPHALTLVMPALATLVGTVFEDGSPLGGARVELVDERAPGALIFGGGRSATADGAGRFTFPQLPVGRTVLEVRHPSRVMPATLTVELVEGENQRRFDLAVAVIEGRVHDTEGKPVAGATVSVERASGGTGGPNRVVFAAISVAGDSDEGLSIGNFGGDPEVRTDDEGRYQLRGVEPDVPLVVKAEKKGFRVTRSDEVTVGLGSVRTQFDIVLEAGGTLVVYSDEPGQWMVLASLEGESEAPKIGRFKSGTATLRDLTPGTWSVRLQPIGPDEGARAFEPKTVEVRARETAELRFE